MRNVDKFSNLCMPDCRVVKLASKKRARAATLKYQVAVTVPLDEGDFAPLSVKCNSFFCGARAFYAQSS